MKREMELIRTILLKVEADPKFDALFRVWMQPLSASWITPMPK
jgi:hypothetical protein